MPLCVAGSAKCAQSLRGPSGGRPPWLRVALELQAGWRLAVRASRRAGPARPGRACPGKVEHPTSDRPCPGRRGLAAFRCAMGYPPGFGIPEPPGPGRVARPPEASSGCRVGDPARRRLPVRFDGRRRGGDFTADWLSIPARYSPYCLGCSRVGRHGFGVSGVRRASRCRLAPRELASRRRERPADPGGACGPPVLRPALKTYGKFSHRVVLFKVSVRVQGGPKRAAHSVAEGSAPPPAGNAGGGTLTAPRRHSWKAEKIGPAEDRKSLEAWGWNWRRQPTGTAWPTRPRCPRLAVARRSNSRRVRRSSHAPVET
jgi:hypothetical protein